MGENCFANPPPPEALAVQMGDNLSFASQKKLRCAKILFEAWHYKTFCGKTDTKADRSIQERGMRLGVGFMNRSVKKTKEHLLKDEQHYISNSNIL